MQIIPTILDIELSTYTEFFSDDLIIAMTDDSNKAKVYVVIQSKIIEHIFIDKFFFSFLKDHSEILKYFETSITISPFIPETGKFSIHTLSNLMKITRDCDFVDIRDELFFTFTYNGSVIPCRKL